MDIRQLRYFSAIAEEGQITRAAKKLHMAQPPLSQQLKWLEEELGVLLMERNGKNMVLTEAGKVLYERAQDVLQRVEEATEEIKEIGDGLRGLLSIGTVRTCFPYIPKRLGSFREKYPLVTFRLYGGDTSILVEYLRNREIELAIVRLPLNLTENVTDFSLLPLPSENFVVVMPEEWSNNNTIRMKEIADLPLMLLHQVSGTGLYELIVDECKKYGFEPTIIGHCPDADMLVSLVREGVGATMLPKSALDSFSLIGLKTLEIEDYKIQSDSAVIWLKDRFLSKKAERFLETFKSE